jgi:hypothetical protein
MPLGKGIQGYFASQKNIPTVWPLEDRLYGPRIAHDHIDQNLYPSIPRHPSVVPGKATAAALPYPGNDNHPRDGPERGRQQRIVEDLIRRLNRKRRPLRAIRSSAPSNDLGGYSNLQEAANFPLKAQTHPLGA